MDQLWTITFVAVFAAAFGIAHWHDREEAKRRERMNLGAVRGGGGAASAPQRATYTTLFRSIAFVAVFAAAFGIAHWHDREEAKRRERMNLGAVGGSGSATSA